jgi:competence protein ComEC
MSTHTKTVVAVVGVLLGIVCGELFRYASEVGMVALVVGVVQTVVYVVERNTERTRAVFDPARPFCISLITLLFSFGLFFGIVRTQFVEEKSNLICATSCTFEAKIVSSPESKNEYQVFTVRSQTQSNDDRVRDVQIRTTLYPKYLIGETVTLDGKVIEPKISTKHDDKKFFDYTSYLHTQNIGSEMFYPKIEIIDHEAYGLSAMLGRIKNDMVDRIVLYVSQPASSLASGMLFGVTSFQEDLKQVFRTAGLSHIVVLSGFNIAIIISSTLFIFSFLPFFLRIIFASLSILLFIGMVGAEASIVRATSMAYISLLALSFGRQYEGRQALVLSLLLIVLYEPYSLLHDVSLHLSFVATAGIVYMSEPLSVLIGRCLSKKKFIHEILTTTLAAYLATLPYLMYTFGSISLYAIIANIFVLPLVPLSMLLSALVVLTSFFSQGLALLFGFLTTILMDYSIACARIVSLLPYASMSVNVSLVGVVAFYIFFFVIFLFLQNKEQDETLRTKREEIISGLIRF